MKNRKKLFCLAAAAALMLVLFTACSALVGASAFTSEAQGKALAASVAQSTGKPLTYSTSLQQKAGSIASWIANSTALRTEGAELRRVVPMGVGSENYGYWLSGDLNAFLGASGCYAADDSALTLAIRAEASNLEQNALLYLPQQSGSAASLAGYAGDATEIGVAFIQYADVTYVVAVFR